MTPGEKASQTRKEHIARQKAKEQEQRRIRETLKRICLQVLDDPSASSADKIKAVEILHDMEKDR